MFGDNCSIYDCTVSRRSKYKGISIFRLQTGDSEFDKNWRDKLLSVITRDREIDSALRERIRSKKMYICQRHYREDQLICHDTRKTVKPAEIPSLNLPLSKVSLLHHLPSQNLENLPTQSFKKHYLHLLLNLLFQSIVINHFLSF